MLQNSAATYKADINVTNVNRHTPLYLAVNNKNWEIAKILVEKSSGIISLPNVIIPPMVRYYGAY